MCELHEISGNLTSRKPVKDLGPENSIVCATQEIFYYSFLCNRTCTIWIYTIIISTYIFLHIYSFFFFFSEKATANLLLSGLCSGS